MRFLILLIFLSSTTAEDARTQFVNSWNIPSFPNNFKFGAATAAYQIEGGWNLEGKGESIWDDLTHKHPDLIADGSNADVGPDSFHLYEEDVKAALALKLDFYRFSISWSRIMPTGDISSLNMQGIQYYDRLINLLLSNHIEPVVTMYHYDLPENLQLLGGLTNSIFIQYFKNYANTLFKHFGSRVKHWITFNEPSDFCVDGYGRGIAAPLVRAHGIGEYLCGDNVLKSHAAAYHLYQTKYRRKFNGKVGITLSSGYYYSRTQDTAAIDRSIQFVLGWFANPIFGKTGGYPDIMRNVIGNNSIAEGRTWSRLPQWSVAETNAIRGSADFIGINYYTSKYVEFANISSHDDPSWDRDMGLKWSVDPAWIRAKSSWLYFVPQGIGDLLRWVKKSYGNPLVLITENGWSDTGELDDIDRISYMRDHLREVLKAVLEDKCNVTAYTAWSLFDNFEWLQGYTEKFGMYKIDENNHERIPKKSASYLRKVIDTKTVPDQ